MSRSTEDVLLIVNHIRHKKTDGALYLMSERLAWMQPTKDSFTISHMYADIKIQKISPDSKDKVQLQVVMHDSSANTFHFVNPAGRTSQQADRESVKDLLQQLLPKFRHKISSELEEKNRLLQEDRELFQLYKDLVVSQVITAEEFWANRASKLTNHGRNENKQEVGISAAFLADIKPQTDGCNGLKYNLTADIIESIFKTYPMVKQKHADYVPHQMTEAEFWTRFFQSHYFHRDRVAMGNKEMFADCAKKDEDDIKDEISKNVYDPLLDLTRISDTTLDEGYGVVKEDSKVSTSLGNLSLIRRFNHHSTMVLKTCAAGQAKRKQEQSSLSNNNISDKNTANSSSSHVSGSTVNGQENSRGDGPSLEGFDEPTVRKKARLKEKILIEDLVQPSTSKGPVLRLTKMDRYLHGPTPITPAKYTTSEDVLHAAATVSQQISTWDPSLQQSVSGALALTVLGELSPGGILMSTSNQQLQQMIPSNIQEELRQLYNALCELLRHFWSCFPTSSKFLEEKVVKMRSTIERFESTKLLPVKQKLDHHHYNINLTAHLEDMLTAAYTKFDTWKSRRILRKS